MTIDSTVQTRKSHCNKCRGERNHTLLAEEQQAWDEEVHQGINLWGDDSYEFLKCCGCDTVHVRQKSRYSQDTDDHGAINVTVSYFPPKLERHEPRWFRDPQWLFMYGDPERTMLEEIYRALGVKAFRLAVMGLRALIETVMVAKLGDKGTFGKNLRALLDAGYISHLQHDHLEAVLEAGHATIHRQFNPTEEDVHALLDITESLVEALYITPSKAKTIDGRVPPRAPRVPSTAPQKSQ